MFTVSYGVIDAALRVMHSIVDDRAGLLARYKYFQRNGFPEGANAGRGKAVAFGVDQILQLLLAFEIVETGCGPTRVMRIVRTNWPELRVAFAQGWLAAREDPGNTRGRPLLVMAPGALAEMSSGEDAMDPVAAPFRISSLAALGQWLADPKGSATRLVVDPAAMVGGFAAFLRRTDGRMADEFDAAFLEWARLEAGVGLARRK